MTAAERILPQLESVRPTGDGKWTARCPAHKDRSPSLSIRTTDDGVLMFCHAGCRIEDIAAALGLTIAELFNAVRTPRYDPEVERLRLEAATLKEWRELQIQTVAAELRGRDALAQRVTEAVQFGTISETEAWDHLAIAYVGRSELEHWFHRLQTEPPLELWLEWKAGQHAR